MRHLRGGASQTPVGKGQALVGDGGVMNSGPEERGAGAGRSRISPTETTGPKREPLREWPPRMTAAGRPYFLSGAGEDLNFPAKLTCEADGGSLRAWGRTSEP